MVALGRESENSLDADLKALEAEFLKHNLC